VTRKKENQKRWLKIGGVAAVVVAVLVAGSFFDAAAPFKRALEWIEGLGAWGPVIFIGLYVLATIFFLPGSFLTLGAGVVFGVIKGSIIVSVSATLGAALAFLVSRYLARKWISRRFEGNAKFDRIDRAVGEQGWKIVALTRLSPVFPFNALNYAYGITRVSFRSYVFASWIGMIPGTVAYVYVGSLAGNLAQIGSKGAERPPAMWALYGVGLVATLAVTIYVTKVAKDAIGNNKGIK